MDNIKEICIIHSISDYAEGLYVQKFMEWVGISCFTYCCHEDSDELNSLLDRKNNKFDIAIYLNDKNAKWKRIFQHLAKVNIDVELSEIWDRINDKSPLLLEQTSLQKMWEEIIDLLEPEDSIRIIIGQLIQTYCQYHVLWKLMSHELSYVMFNEREDVERSIQEWNQIIEELECFKKNNLELNSVRGMERLDHALKYSMYKRCEAKELIHECESSEIETLINSVNEIYAYNNKFYMGEWLKGKMAMANIGQRNYAPFYFLNCAKMCKTDACASDHYYMLGKSYELVRQQETAHQVFEKAYECNPLNFKALYKMAVNNIVNGNLGLGRKQLFQVLQLLHLDRGSSLYEINMKKLPIPELSYACKCYMLLGTVEEEYENYRNAEFYYEEANRIRRSIEHNTYLKKMYPFHFEQLRTYWKLHLLHGLIERKLSNVQAMER